MVGAAHVFALRLAEGEAFTGGEWGGHRRSVPGPGDAWDLRTIVPYQGEVRSRAQAYVSTCTMPQLPWKVLLLLS